MPQHPTEGHNIHVAQLWWREDLVCHPAKITRKYDKPHVAKRNLFVSNTFSRIIMSYLIKGCQLTLGRKSSSVAILPYKGTSNIICRQIHKKWTHTLNILEPKTLITFIDKDHINKWRLRVTSSYIQHKTEKKYQTVNKKTDENKRAWKEEREENKSYDGLIMNIHEVSYTEHQTIRDQK